MESNASIAIVNVECVAMKAKQLKIGDRIRIIDIAGNGKPGYMLLPETKRVYKKLIARNRPVRIRSIDDFGWPWYECRFKRKNGQWEWHSLAVYDHDNNWVFVGRSK